MSLRRSSRKRSHDQNSSQDTPKEEGGPSGLKKARPYEDEGMLFSWHDFANVGFILGMYEFLLNVKNMHCLLWEEMLLW